MDVIHILDILTCRFVLFISCAMTEDGITLEELSERSGVEPRTLRSWISEGLLAPPFKPGRGARYPTLNADRALAVRTLKEVYGLTLSEIGRRFMTASEEMIREWASEARPASVPRGSARDYLRKIQARTRPDGAKRNRMLPPLSELQQDFDEHPKMSLSYRQPDRSPLDSGIAEHWQELASIEQLILQLEKVLDAPAPRRSRGTIWTRISVTPDLELSVRGDLEPRERALFEQLADQFRAILTGRTKND